MKNPARSPPSVLLIMPPPSDAPVDPMSIPKADASPASVRWSARLLYEHLRFEQHQIEAQRPADLRLPPTPSRLRGADQDLFLGVQTQNVERVKQALRDGADPNGSWSSIRWIVRDAYVPATPLGVALWMAYEHSDHLPHDALRDDNGQVVDALLNAGADPDPDALRRFVQDNGHPASERLEQAVLDRMAQGRPVPGTLWTMQDRRRWDQEHPHEVETSVLPMTVMHAPQLWLHRAVDRGHAAAVEQWFAHGGVAGTGGGASALESLWDRRINRLGSGQAAYPDWLRTLGLVRTSLLQEPSPAVFRKEIVKTLDTYAGQLDRYRPDDLVMTACRDWVRDLLRERPLTVYQLLEPEVWALNLDDQHAERVREVLRELENDHLRTVITASAPPDDGARARRRL